MRSHRRAPAVRQNMRRIVAAFVAAAVLAFGGLAADTHGQKNSSAGVPAKLSLPVKDGSTRFMVVGDTGTGGKGQYELAAVMLRYWEAFPFEFALLMGDNLYGSE